MHNLIGGFIMEEHVIVRPQEGKQELAANIKVDFLLYGGIKYLGCYLSE